MFIEIHFIVAGVKQEIELKCSDLTNLKAELTKSQEENKMKSSQLEEADKKVSRLILGVRVGRLGSRRWL